MAQQNVGSLIINLEANTVSLLRGMESAERSVQGATSNIVASARQADAAVEGMGSGMRHAGLSAGEMTQAMRMLPAQLTDIVTSLASGQNPMTVFIQQGGQLKDMFGGIVPAARAMGQYVAGLVNPYTLAAAAVGGLVIAHEKGAAESRAFSAALIETNNAAGMSVDSMADMAAAIDAYYGTQSAAAAAIAAVAGTGAVSAANMERFAAVSMQWADVTDQAVGDVAKQFADLAKDPVSAVLKLDESMRFLTATTLDQIQSLQEQGKETEAASLAQNAFADVLARRAPEMQENIGSLQRGWRAVASAVKEAGDALLDIGRKQTMAEQIADKRQALARAQAGAHNYSQPAWLVGQLKAELDAMESDARRLATDSARDAEREAARKSGVAATRDLNQLLDSGATKAQKMSKELTDMHRKVSAAAAAGEEYTAQEIAAMESTIRNKYKESSRRPTRASQYGSTEDREVANLKSLIDNEQQLAAALAEHGVEADKLTPGQKLLNKLLQEQSVAITVTAQAHIGRKVALAQDLVLLEKANLAQKEMAKSARELGDAIANSQRGDYLQADQLRKQYETPLQRLQREGREEVGRIDGNNTLSAAEQLQMRGQAQANTGRSINQLQNGIRSELGAVPESEKIVQAHQEMQRRIAEVTAEGSAERVQLEHAANRRLQQDTEALEQQKTSTILSMSGQVFDGLAGMVEQAAGRQSAAYRLMFLASKAVAFGEAIVNTNVAYTAALKLTPAYAETVRGLGYASAAVIAAQAVQGMAHDGIDNIPREGTWLLDKGERVVDSRTNADLKDYLKQSRAGGGSSGVSIVINNNAGVDVQASQSTGPNGEAQITLDIVRRVASSVFDNRLGAELRPGGVIHRAVGG